MRTVLVLHVAAATVFFGNVVAAFAWKVAAEHARNPVAIHEVLGIALRLDTLVTVPAAAAVTITGTILTADRWRTGSIPGWLTASMVIWIASALLAVSILIPALRRLHSLAAEGKALSGDYARISAKWNALAVCLIVSPLLVLSLMVAQPVK